MSERVNLGKELPHIYQSVLEVDRLAEAAALGAGWTAGFTHRAKPRTVWRYCRPGEKPHISQARSVRGWH